MSLLNKPNFGLDLDVVNSIKAEIRRLSEQEEKFSFQRSRIKWLKWGVQNSKLFHASTVQRRDRNKIQRLRNSQGRRAESQEEIYEVIFNHFQQIYTTSNVQRFDSCLQHVPKLVTDEMNEVLCSFVTDQEIKRAVDALGAFKACGVYGLNGHFYQQHWRAVENSVCNAVKEVFQGGSILEAINQTQVVLIPKIDRPEDIGQFRPISCCNFYLKL